MMMQRGDNQGAARMAQGNIWGNAINDIGAQYMRRTPGYGGGASFGGPLDSFFRGNGGSGD